MSKTNPTTQHTPPELEGEGNVTAARRQRAATERFVKSGQVRQAARAAAPKSTSEADELARAERAGRAHARR